MKAFPFLAAAALSLAALGPGAFAQGMDHGKTGAHQGMDHGQTGMDHGQMQMPEVEAEVRRIDKDNGKVTLRHGAIKNMDMPPMTMVFNVRDKSVLDGLAAGDKVLFTAVNENGQMLINTLKPLKP